MFSLPPESYEPVKEEFLIISAFLFKADFSYFSQKSDEFGWGQLSCTDSPDEGYKEEKNEYSLFESEFESNSTVRFFH